MKKVSVDARDLLPTSAFVQFWPEMIDVKERLGKLRMKASKHEGVYYLVHEKTVMGKSGKPEVRRRKQEVTKEFLDMHFEKI